MNRCYALLLSCLAGAAIGNFVSAALGNHNWMLALHDSVLQAVPIVVFIILASILGFHRGETR